MTKKLDIIEVAEKALAVIESLLNKKAEGIISVTKEGEEWKVLAEMLERKAVPDTQDILSIYELKLSGNLELTEYKRIGLRRRDDLRVEEEELK
ncbi:MAG: gas vesicle protein GvpO [Candidatus Methanoperedens sp.]|nr:gas vesicle protein GvpO [Candidatus Methanoperedens sp.]